MNYIFHAWRNIKLCALDGTHYIWHFFQKTLNNGITIVWHSNLTKENPLRWHVLIRLIVNSV